MNIIVIRSLQTDSVDLDQNIPDSSLYKQCRPRSDCSWRRSLIRVYTFCHMSHRMTKPTKWPVRPANTQISLGIRPVWSESLLSAWRKVRSLATYKVHSKDSDQTGRMLRLIWVSVRRTGHFVGLVRWRLISFGHITVWEYHIVQISG